LKFYSLQILFKSKSSYICFSRFFSSKSRFSTIVSNKFLKQCKRKRFLIVIKKLFFFFKQKLRKNNIKVKKIRAKLRVINKMYKGLFTTYTILGLNLKHWVSKTFFLRHNQIKNIFYLYDRKQKKKVFLELPEHRRQIWFAKRVNERKLARYRPFYRKFSNDLIYKNFFIKKNYSRNSSFNADNVIDYDSKFFTLILSNVSENILPVLPAYKKNFISRYKYVLIDTKRLKYLRKILKRRLRKFLRRAARVRWFNTRKARRKPKRKKWRHLFVLIRRVRRHLKKRFLRYNRYILKYRRIVRKWKRNKRNFVSSDIRPYYIVLDSKWIILKYRLKFKRFHRRLVKLSRNRWNRRRRIRRKIKFLNKRNKFLLKKLRRVKKVRRKILITRVTARKLKALNLRQEIKRKNKSKPKFKCKLRRSLLKYKRIRFRKKLRYMKKKKKLNLLLIKYFMRVRFIRRKIFFRKKKTVVLKKKNKKFVTIFIKNHGKKQFNKNFSLKKNKKFAKISYKKYRKLRKKIKKHFINFFTKKSARFYKRNKMFFYLRSQYILKIPAFYPINFNEKIRKSLLRKRKKKIQFLRLKKFTRQLTKFRYRKFWRLFLTFSKIIRGYKKVALFTSLNELNLMSPKDYRKFGKKSLRYCYKIYNNFLYLLKFSFSKRKKKRKLKKNKILYRFRATILWRNMGNTRFKKFMKRFVKSFVLKKKSILNRKIAIQNKHKFQFLSNTVFYSNLDYFYPVADETTISLYSSWKKKKKKITNFVRQKRRKIKKVRVRGGRWGRLRRRRILPVTIKERKYSFGVKYLPKKITVDLKFYKSSLKKIKTLKLIKILKKIKKFKLIKILKKIKKFKPVKILKIMKTVKLLKTLKLIKTLKLMKFLKKRNRKRLFLKKFLIKKHKYTMRYIVPKYFKKYHKFRSLIFKVRSSISYNDPAIQKYLFSKDKNKKLPVLRRFSYHVKRISKYTKNSLRLHYASFSKFNRRLFFSYVKARRLKKFYFPLLLKHLFGHPFHTYVRMRNWKIRFNYDKKPKTFSNIIDFFTRKTIRFARYSRMFLSRNVLSKHVLFGRSRYFFKRRYLNKLSNFFKPKTRRLITRNNLFFREKIFKFNYIFASDDFKMYFKKLILFKPLFLKNYGRKFNVYLSSIRKDKKVSQVNYRIATNTRFSNYISHFEYKILSVIKNLYRCNNINIIIKLLSLGAIFLNGKVITYAKNQVKLGDLIYLKPRYLLLNMKYFSFTPYGFLLHLQTYWFMTYSFLINFKIMAAIIYRGYNFQFFFYTNTFSTKKWLKFFLFFVS
jgi:hypothetical protein